MSEDEKTSVSRSEALKRLAIVPAAVIGIASTMSDAQAADNKKQFKYQAKPGKGGEKCSSCRFFKAPHGCSIVTGTISPAGWCIAWSKK
ncbi:MAG TPA: high-potential iron-sulfur protein [Candidatus Baltobacteraceae bacterium]